MGILKRIIRLGVASKSSPKKSRKGEDNFETTRATLQQRAQQLTEKQTTVSETINNLSNVVGMWAENVVTAEARLAIEEGKDALSPAARVAVSSLLVQAKAYHKTTLKNLTQLKQFHGDICEKQAELSKVDIRLNAIAYSQSIHQSFRSYSNETPDSEMLSIATADEEFLRELRRLEYSTTALISLTVGEE